MRQGKRVSSVALIVVGALAHQDIIALGKGPDVGPAVGSLSNQSELVANIIDDDRCRAIATYPVDIAITIYLACRWSTHPPNHEYASTLVSRGVEVMDALLGQIDRAQQLSDYVYMPDYFFLLSYGQKRGAFYVCHNSEKMARLRDAISRMKLPDKHVGDEIIAALTDELVESVRLYMSWIEQCAE